MSFEMSRREFIKTGAAVGLAAFINSIPESAEAFGSLSQEEFNMVIDEMNISVELGGDETREELKDLYSRLSMGQKRFFTIAVVCRSGGTPTLTEYDKQAGSFKVECSK